MTALGQKGSNVRWPCRRDPPTNGIFAVVFYFRYDDTQDRLTDEQTDRPAAPCATCRSTY